MDVSQEKHMQHYIEQHTYKHNLVDENYNMYKGVIGIADKNEHRP